MKKKLLAALYLITALFSVTGFGVYADVVWVPPVRYWNPAALIILLVVIALVIAGILLLVIRKIRRKRREGEK